MNTHRESVGGFTLIELMVTLAIAAVLLLIAVPSMISFKRNAELTSATNELLASINAARSDAMKRGVNAVIRPLSGVDWNTGVVVFVDMNLDSNLDAADIKVREQKALPSYFNVVSSNTAIGHIAFSSTGYAKANTITTLTIKRTDVGTDDLSETRRIKVSMSGRVRSCKPVNATDPLCTSGPD